MSKGYSSEDVQERIQRAREERQREAEEAAQQKAKAEKRPVPPPDGKGQSSQERP